MGGCRCTYKNCQNTTKTTENIHFFHYPVKNKERCKIWIENAEKPHFCDLEEEQLRNKVICELHFEDRFFPNQQKKRLLQAAIPTLDGGCEEKKKSDLKVLPVNEEATEFVLDADSMFNRIAGTPLKVETFIYKDGAIVPVDSDKSNGDFDELNKSNSSTMDVEMKPPESIKQTSGMYVFMDENAMHMKSKVDKGNHFVENKASTLNKFSADRTEKRVIQRATNTKQQLNSTRMYIEKKYLRRIKQNSREIENIKRILKRNLERPKPDRASLIKEFKEVLPATLYTIVNLCLGNQLELSDHDIEFFNDLYISSPEMYKLLVEKYNWSLPRIQQVKEDNVETVLSK